jgi:RNA polymerase subunit RPABC4/transcription elongation factor Spt4
MSRIREELKVVPRVAWIAAFAVYFAFAAFAFLVVLQESPWPVWAKALFAGGIPLPLFVFVLLIGYVNGDARRRGMRHVLWTLLAIFIPNAIGIILYFILRDPPMEDCPKCGAVARGGFTFCPSCGTALSQACPDCRQAIEPGWSHCPSCGRGLRAA